MTKMGFFDSGIGGLSILYQVMKLIPDIECFYLSDDFYAPYGEKSSEFVLQRSRFLTTVLQAQGVELIVVACNTATAVAINNLRQEFPQLRFVGVEPYINVLNKKDISPQAKVGVLSTTLTSQSQRFLNLKKEKDPDNRIFSYASENLAMLVEEAFIARTLTKDIRSKIKSELAFLKKEKCDYLILGCTHYSLIKDFLEEELGVITISPCPYVAQRVFDLVPVKKEGQFSSEFYFQNGLAEKNLRQEQLVDKINFKVLSLASIPLLNS